MNTADILRTKYGFILWEKDLLLIPMKLWDQIPIGTILTTINDREEIKGLHSQDKDTRYGALGVGIITQQYEDILKILEENVSPN